MSFIKPVIVKNNAKIKSSERKQLLDTFCKQYNLQSVNLPNELTTTEVFRVKLCPTDSRPVWVYTFSNCPLLLDRDSCLIPTIYLLWLLPNLLPHLVTHDALVPKFTAGADLMMPGLVFDKPLTPTSLGGFEKNTLCAISTVSNRAPVAIGYTNMSNEDMFMSAGHGKAVLIYHVLGDRLCSLGHRPARPIIPSKTGLLDLEDSLEGNSSMLAFADDFSAVTVNDLDSELDSAEPDADKLLHDCFLRGLNSVPDKLLPMPVNVFYSQYVLSQAPDGQLNIRKTKHKKVGPFLRAMEAEDLIGLDEPTPGVLMLKSVRRDHPALSSASASNNLSRADKAWPPGYNGPPKIEEVWTVSGPVSALFAPSSPSCVTQSEINSLTNRYIERNHLQCKDQCGATNLIQLDSLLTKLCPPAQFIEAPESNLANPVYLIRRVDLMRAVYERLNRAYRITPPPGSDSSAPIMWKRKRPPSIELSVAKANGKFVTRVSNVPLFCIDPEAFSKQLQLSLACSVSRVPAEGDHQPDTCTLQAQGDHALAISKLLTNVYKIPKHYINGFVEDSKKKNKGKKKS